MRIITDSPWSVPSKPCDTCKSSQAAVFCRLDSAFSCLSCDSKIHNKHARVVICEVCEQAPAVVTCKADTAALCVTCDFDIHSANPLASRHERVPIEPFYGSAQPIINSTHLLLNQNSVGPGSWLLPPDPGSEDLFLSVGSGKGKMIASTAAADHVFPVPFMDFGYSNSVQRNSGLDSVVPVQNKPTTTTTTIGMMNNNNNNNENCFNMDFATNKLSTYHQPLNQSMSSSSLDVGVVPDGSDISYRNMSVVVEQSQHVPASTSDGTTTTTSHATPLSGLDREARVLRYKEKRKNRKFEKTIRYASRKAYAESRPRIKGRFAKRTKMDSDAAGAGSWTRGHMMNIARFPLFEI
ncbi:hypothetical protein ACFE04_008243 [Oxalis oulophora]